MRLAMLALGVVLGAVIALAGVLLGAILDGSDDDGW
jgi:hypothetical protein